MYVAPELSEEAAEELTEAYMGMRKLGTGRNTITATPRQFESLIRLWEALAKMRLSKVVTLADVKEAVRLMKVATRHAATDPNTGLIDMDLIAIGITTGSRQKINVLVEAIKDLFRTNDMFRVKGIKYAVLYEELKKKMDGGEASVVELFTEVELRDATTWWSCMETARCHLFVCQYSILDRN
eukprot:TRINITY_DN2903_c0_g1_i1.p2 TRINITY_DN2903_c0_g1~~TRINITY_DN2903_c0_g1_i1.p2  ORF type:complete len:183 (+),score=46.52 TRINITY_DN2903_c0_g1_i1:1558-2106(+)